jgi:hypothetical protein
MNAASLRRLRSVVLSLLAVVVLCPSIASAAPRPQVASFETGDFSQFDQVNEQTGSLANVGEGYDDSHAAKATYRGGGSNGFARVIQDVNWGIGDDVWYGGAYYLPRGFKDDMQGAVALLRWDDFGSHPNNAAHGGIVIWGGDKRARLVRERLGSNSRTDELSRSFNLPEGRWFWIEVHQRLSPNGNAVNEVYLDGERVDRTNEPNTFAGRTVDRMRYGLVAIADGAQRRSLSLRFDRTSVQENPLGPVGGRPAPPASDDRRSDGGTVTTARFTRKVRRCVNRALVRAARRGDASGLPRATRRCVQKYAVRVKRRA